MGVSIGFVDKNGNDIRDGDTVQTFDRRGRKWVGTIQPEDPTKIAAHPFLKEGRTLYIFKPPYSYGTWINDQKYASTLEIIDKLTFTNIVAQIVRGVSNP